MAVGNPPDISVDLSSRVNVVADVKCQFEARCSENDASNQVASWQWILLELDGIRMEDTVAALRKERWLQKLELYMKRANATQSAPVADGASVVLYDLDTEAPTTKDGVEAYANTPQTDAMESNGYESSRSASPQDQLSPQRRSSRVSDAGSVSEEALDVIKRLTRVAKAGAVSTQDSISTFKSITSSSQSFRVNMTARSWRSDVTRKLAGRARLKLQDFESNAWCISAMQCFTLLLSGFELSQICTTNSFSTKDEVCLSIHSIQLFGNFLFTLEVFLYIMIYPWKFLCKSYYFWVDVFAVITYYTLAIGGWRSDRDALVELLAVSIPLLRILKITRRSKSWRLLVMALKRSAEPISVPALFLTLVISIGSAFLYWIEKVAPHPDERPAFESIPHAIWFSIVTVSTTGYGDVTPHTDLGKLACCVLIGVGVCCFAMPLAVVGNCFCSVWEQRDVILLTEKLKSIFAMAGVTFADLQHIFDAADVDGSGNMELDEFIGLFRMLNLEIGKREIVKFFQMMDVAGNGKVSFEDFREHLGMFQAVESGLLPNHINPHVLLHSNSVANIGWRQSQTRVLKYSNSQHRDLYASPIAAHSHCEDESNNVGVQL